MKSLSDPAVIAAVLDVFCLIIYRIIYNIYLHPLSHIPGPKRATFSSLWEFYHDVVRGGRYLWEIEKMHQKYGPITRNNPREIHIKDPRYYEEVYSSGSRRQEKDPHVTPAFLSPHSVVSTIDHDHHRVRKNLLKNFFSRRSLERLSPMIRTSTELVCQKLRRAHSADQPVGLESLFADLTADIISHCAFGESYGYLRHDAGVVNDIQYGAAVFAVGFHVNRFFPVFRRLMASVPPHLLKTLLPQCAESLARIDTIHENAKLSLERSVWSKNTDHSTIFDALTDASVPAEERTMPRLMDESWVVLAAGTTTTARALSMASFHIFSNERILLALREELRPVMPRLDSQPTFAQLEGLPYLSAIINESLRLSHGVLFRAPRIAPDDVLHYDEFVIPPGTPVSISTCLTHMDPEFFPSPHQFRPERWLEARQSGFPLHKYLVAFSRGHRQCLGMSLSYLEMYTALAHLAHKFDMQLHETTAENVSVGREMGLPFPEKVVYQVKVKITRVVEV